MPEYFEKGKYIYECKSSDKINGPINQKSLKKWISDVEKLLRRKQPEGFRYVFPINELNAENRNLLKQLQEEFQDSVDIQYYDCNQVDNLLRNLEKIDDWKDLVNYIKEIRNSK